jgi:hypothetical protein
MDAVFFNKDTSQKYNFKCPLKLIRVKELKGGYLQGYEFNTSGLSKPESENLTDKLAKIVRESEIKKRQIEKKYYKDYD